ncbi:MAG: VWA domain-containing protein [Chlamydiota bacterium]|nr:VWA domain-containing protein [Chlamydiota bacterium]
MRNSQSIDQKFLLIAVISTLALHFVALFSLQGMKMSFETANHAYMENHLAKNQDRPSDNESKLIKERNIQLSEVFVELTKEKYDIDTPEFNLPTRTEDFLCTEISSEDPTDLTFIEENNLNDGDVLNEAFENSQDYAANEEDESGENDTDTYAVNLPAEISQLVAVEDDLVTTELLQATEGLHGEVISENIDSITEAPCLTIGTVEGDDSEGTSIDTRSGILDEGGFDKYLCNESDMLPPDLNEQYDDADLIAYTSENVSRARRMAPIESTSTRTYSPNNPMSLKDNNNSAGHIASSEDFNISLEYTPRKNEDGYLFRVILSSKEGIEFRKIKQNVIFLIDRSHSITKARFEASKIAVAKALEELSPEDTFNILIFDKNITQLSPFNLPYKPENIALANEFLENEKHGGMFASTELYTSLGTIVPKVVAENEVNTAILLSDGDTYLAANRQRSAIKKWTNDNKGKVSLYCLATGTNNNFPMLDVISVFNKGSLYVANNNQHLVKAITELMRDIKHPIGKNILTTAISKDKNADVQIGPPQRRSPNLYENKNYTLYGSTSSLEDFYIFFQGRYYDKRINIKSLVSFDQGRKVTNTEIEKLWSMQEAYRLYDQYMVDGDIGHIHAARELLEKYDIPVAFN